MINKVNKKKYKAAGNQHEQKPKDKKELRLKEGKMNK